MCDLLDGERSKKTIQFESENFIEIFIPPIPDNEAENCERVRRQRRA